MQGFLQSFELSTNPDGIDIASGALNSEESPQIPVVSAKEVSRKLMIVIKPEPHYTPEARRRMLQGEVRLRVVLSASGKVTNIQVVSGLPDLAASATEAAGEVYFIPAVKDGRFVSTAVELLYNFNIY